MSMNYESVSSTSMEVIESAFRSTMFPHVKIKFQLSIHTQTSNYVVNPDSPMDPHFLESLPTIDYNTAAQLTVEESLSRDHVREVLVEAIGDRLPDFERRHLITFAWAEVYKSFTAETLRKYTILSLHFKINIRRRHLYAVETDYPRMVPAADSSFPLLEKCEAEERCCCICLEEVGGGLRMPCSHVFHDGCIIKWLRTSHYCPLCRYQMPVD
ncbi:receptor homology region, transmembrane domain- and RING domain-containing protein 4-like [Salvia miltiorrhiza]|uniref:receptor homology region, transmembrane domain- and RING domain-containing protein 4-like n=1 Tax=Salvia miltiorrhiza TaxID=226208 RepID=UPI0025AC3448|nr:receptor homology region, transmembrane domain- and RING domain-containing protein 4-like [Salvia miltiorrhiza]